MGPPCIESVQEKKNAAELLQQSDGQLPKKGNPL